MKYIVAIMLGLSPTIVVADTLGFINARYGFHLDLPYSIDGMALNWSRRGWEGDADGAWFKLVGPDIDVLTFGSDYNAQRWADAALEIRDFVISDGYTINADEQGPNHVTFSGTFEGEKQFAWRSELAQNCEGADIVISVRIAFARSDIWFEEHVPAILESLRGCDNGA